VEGRTSRKRLFVDMDDQALRERIKELSPQIKADVDHMAALIRELVNLERAKAGLDDPKGSITLRPNPDKKTSTDPDLLGAGHITGRNYRAAAWTTKDGQLKIALLWPRRKRP